MERRRVRIRKKRKSTVRKVWRNWTEYYSNHRYDKFFAVVMLVIVLLVGLYFFGLLKFMGLKYEPPPPPPPTIETSS